MAGISSEDFLMAAVPTSQWYPRAYEDAMGNPNYNYNLSYQLATYRSEGARLWYETNGMPPTIKDDGSLECIKCGHKESKEVRLDTRRKRYGKKQTGQKGVCVMCKNCNGFIPL